MLEDDKQNRGHFDVQYFMTKYSMFLWISNYKQVRGYMKDETTQIPRTHHEGK